MTLNFDIRRAGLESAPAQTLIEALNAELRAMYPEPGANHFRLEPHEVDEGRGIFLIAARGDRPIGCGALRSLDTRTGEIKRMFVIAEERGNGIGRAILEALEAEARRLGFSRVLLETGTRQLAAIELYERAGFVRIPPYGEYVASAATSLCMAKALGSATAETTGNETIASLP